MTVIDGDTIRLKLRLEDFDTPEIHGPCPDLAVRAKLRLEALTKDRSAVIVLDPSSNCGYGRVCGKLFVGNRNVADILVAEGLAQRYPGKPRPWCPNKE
jgi:endonuclease YncB( thermonuclease family)